MIHTPVFFAQNPLSHEASIPITQLLITRYEGTPVYQFTGGVEKTFGVKLYADTYNLRVKFNFRNLIVTIPFESVLPEISVPFFRKIENSVAELSMNFGHLNSNFQVYMPKKTIIAGGIEQANELNWGELQEYRKRFLTNMPAVIQTDASTPNALYWLANHAPITVALRAKIVYDDSTEETITLSTEPLESNYIYAINTSYRGIRLASNPLKTVVSYSIFLENNGEAISEVVQYDLYKFCDKDNITRIVYKNSFGQFDTAFFTGKRVELYGSSTANARVIDKRSTFFSEIERRIKVNTGEQRQDFVQALPDLLLSKEIYYVENGLFVPFTIETSQISPFGLFERKSIELEFVSQDVNNYYSRRK